MKTFNVCKYHWSALVCAWRTSSLIQNTHTYQRSSMRQSSCYQTLLSCFVIFKRISQKLLAEATCCLHNIHWYLFNLLSPFLDICYYRSDTVSWEWEMFYVSIIVREEYDNLYLGCKNIQIFKTNINFVKNSPSEVWVYFVIIRILFTYVPIYHSRISIWPSPMVSLEVSQCSSQSSFSWIFILLVLCSLCLLVFIWIWK